MKQPVFQSENNPDDFIKGAENTDGKALVKLLLNLLGFWPVYLITAVVFIVTAYFGNKYSDRVYSGKTVINISTDSKSGAGAATEAIMTQIGYYNPRLTFENEVVTLKSYSLIEKTLGNLDFGIIITGRGRVRERELYGSNVPFMVTIDSNHIQDQGLSWVITPTSESEYLIRSEGLSTPINFKSPEKPIILDEVNTIDEDKGFKFGDWIEGENYKFKLEREPLTSVTSYQYYVVEFIESKRLTGTIQQNLEVKIGRAHV